jgi:hypothetical protein
MFLVVSTARSPHVITAESECFNTKLTTVITSRYILNFEESEQLGRKTGSREYQQQNMCFWRKLALRVRASRSLGCFGTEAKKNRPQRVKSPTA